MEFAFLIMVVVIEMGKFGFLPLAHIREEGWACLEKILEYLRCSDKPGNAKNHYSVSGSVLLDLLHHSGCIIPPEEKTSLVLVIMVVPDW